jgi:hypothetical protein
MNSKASVGIQATSRDARKSSSHSNNDIYFHCCFMSVAEVEPLK